MRKLTAVLLILTIFVLSGCSALSLDGSDIMCPPKATGDKAEIQKLIDKNTSSQYTLKYPKSGLNRNSIIMHDIDSDEDKDAIAIYTVSEDTEIHALFVECNDGEYSVLSDMTIECSGIDRVDFADIDGNGVDETLIGYSQKNSSKNNLNIYQYNDEIIKSENTYSYSSLATGDFNSDKKDDILIISLYSDDTAAQAKLMSTDSKGVLSEIGTVPLDSDISQLAAVTYGQIELGVYGVVIDGITSSGDYTTQVVFFDSSKPALLNPLYSYHGYNETRRSSQVCSLDYDNDEIIDIPICSAMAYDPKEDIDDLSLRIDWSDINTQTYALTTSSSAIMCPLDGYLFTMPGTWHDSVTARYDDKTRETTIYAFEYTNDVPKKTKKLLTIKAFTEDDFNKSDSGYTEITNFGSTIYAYSIGEADDYLSITGDEIVKLFKLVNQ